MLSHDDAPQGMTVAKVRITARRRPADLGQRAHLTAADLTLS
jgi:hypothetical protein